MNLLVHPSYGFNNPSVETEVSIARIDVVPTAHTRFFFILALLTIDTHLSLIMTCSESILCLEVFHFNRSECSQTYVQGNLSELNSFDFKALE